MLGNVSIKAENGRSMKTYGLAGFTIINMKIVFLCIVTGVTCSARATEDIGPYSGIRFGLSPAEQKALEDSVEAPRPYNFLGPILKQDSSWPEDQLSATNRDRKLSRLSEKISESLRDIIELIKQRKRRFPFKYPKYDSEEERKLPDYYEEEFRSRTPQYQYRAPHQRILDDYPPDEDFRFRGEPEVEQSQVVQQLKNKEEFGSYQSVAPVESSGKSSLEEVVADNSAEFAYSPFDPRYYESVSSTVRKPTTTTTATTSTLAPTKSNHQSTENAMQSDGDDQILIEERNGDAFYNSQGVAEERQADDSVQVVAVQPHSPEGDAAGVLIIAFVAGISAAATVGLIAFGIGWYNLQKHVKNASDVEYPAYGITGPNKDVSPSGDRRLAQSAQMYHYQHQKQQIIAMESRSAAGDRHGSVSEADSDEENEEGDYTVYECPGLAPTGEMEVKNPLFQDDPTPAQTPATKAGTNGSNQKK